MAPYSAGNLPVVNLSAACCLPDQISSALLVFALLQCGAVLLAAFLLPCYCCPAAAAVRCCSGLLLLRVTPACSQLTGRRHSTHCWTTQRRRQQHDTSLAWLPAAVAPAVQEPWHGSRRSGSAHHGESPAAALPTNSSGTKSTGSTAGVGQHTMGVTRRHTDRHQLQNQLRRQTRAVKGVGQHTMTPQERAHVSKSSSAGTGPAT
jgi:hypothetical protein